MNYIKEMTLILGSFNLCGQLLLGPSIFAGSPMSGTDTSVGYVPGTSNCTRLQLHFANPIVILTFAIEACEEDEGREYL